MHKLQHIRTYLLVCSLVIVVQPLRGLAQQNASAAKSGSRSSAIERDGQHDFDFEIGTWKSHISRRLHPLTGSNTWVETEGVAVFRKVWNGRANLMELEIDSPTGHFDELCLRLYNPQSHQWSFNFANSKEGMMAPPMTGKFKNGRGEFIDQEPFNGKIILVRHVYTDITPDSHHFEQSFSDDGGKTWESNFVATLTREKQVAAKPESQDASMERDGQHDFDFEIGTWKTHLSRLQHPLTGSTTWVKYEGTSVVRKVWNGRANLVELEVHGPAGRIEGLSLRLYNPQSHQWSLNFANSNSGTMTQPAIGEFKNGRGEFYDQEPSGPNGRTILVRFVISNITPNSAHFEQSFSDDGGKTWEVNWIATDTRIKDQGGK